MEDINKELLQILLTSNHLAYSKLIEFNTNIFNALSKNQVATEIVTPVATEIVTPVATEIVTPVATEIVTPVATEIVTPVATEIVTPVATEIVTPMVDLGFRYALIKEPSDVGRLKGEPIKTVKKTIGRYVPDAVYNSDAEERVVELRTYREFALHQPELVYEIREETQNVLNKLEDHSAVFTENVKKEDIQKLYNNHLLRLRLDMLIRMCSNFGSQDTTFSNFYIPNVIPEANKVRQRFIEMTPYPEQFSKEMYTIKGIERNSKIPDNWRPDITDYWMTPGLLDLDLDYHKGYRLVQKLREDNFDLMSGILDPEEFWSKKIKYCIREVAKMLDVKVQLVYNESMYAECVRIAEVSMKARGAVDPIVDPDFSYKEEFIKKFGLADWEAHEQEEKDRIWMSTH